MLYQSNMPLNGSFIGLLYILGRFVVCKLRSGAQFLANAWVRHQYDMQPF